MLECRLSGFYWNDCVPQALSSSATTPGSGTASNGPIRAKTPWKSTNIHFMCCKLYMHLVSSQTSPFQRQVVPEAEADRGHWCSAVQTQKWPVRHEEGRPRTEQGLFVFGSSLIFNHSNWNEFQFFLALKAYCGFKKHDDEPDIATGKWGCGAFHGDAQLKGKLQVFTVTVWETITSSLLITFLCSFDPADGCSKSQERFGFLHLQRWETAAGAGADVQPAAQRKGHSWWETLFTVLEKDSCCHKHKQF